MDIVTKLTTVSNIRITANHNKDNEKSVIGQELASIYPAVFRNR